MLKRFEVENFKGFKDKLIFNLSAYKYNFYKELIHNNIVNKALIYGRNGIGKTNLGIALFDIVYHLTDKDTLNSNYLINYLNLNSNKEYAEFKYIFIFDNDELIYEYKKKDYNNLIEERLSVNGKLIILYNYFNKTNNYIDENIRGTLQVELIDNKLSILKYIYRNTPTNKKAQYIRS